MLAFLSSIIRWLFSLLVKLLILAMCIVLIVILSQDFQVFPILYSSLFEKSLRLPDDLPTGVKSTFLTTHDGKKLEMWQLEASNPTTPKTVALILHGNGGRVDEFFHYQKWLQTQGISSYSLEYRGIGKSTGWPSEDGIYLDVQTGIEYVMGNEDLETTKLVLLGISLGTAPAAYLAAQHKVEALILLSPYVSVPDIVKTRAFFKYFAPFLWYTFPTQEFLNKTSSCVIMAHGEQDDVIPFSNFKILRDNFSGKGKLLTIASKVSGHNDLFSNVKDDLALKLRECLN